MSEARSASATARDSMSLDSARSSSTRTWGSSKEAGDIRPDRGLQLLTLDRGADALASERAAMGHGAVAAVARPPGPGTAEGEAADGAADERAEEVGMARVAGHGAVALESGDGGVPDVIGDQRGTEAEITSRPLGFVDLRPYWRTPL